MNIAKEQNKNIEDYSAESSGQKASRWQVTDIIDYTFNWISHSLLMTTTTMMMMTIITKTK